MGAAHPPRRGGAAFGVPLPAVGWRATTSSVHVGSPVSSVGSLGHIGSVGSVGSGGSGGGGRGVGGDAMPRNDAAVMGRGRRPLPSRPPAGTGAATPGDRRRAAGAVTGGDAATGVRGGAPRPAAPVAADADGGSGVAADPTA